MSHDWNWSEKWEFSEAIKDKIDKFTTELRSESCESRKTKNWNHINNFKFRSDPEVDTETTNKTHVNSYDIDGITEATVQCIASGSLDESKFADIPAGVQREIFQRIYPTLNEENFTNFCKILSTWKDPTLLDVAFNTVILNKIKEEEEAPLYLINTITNLGCTKPKYLSQCIINLIQSESDFADVELLKSVFGVLPDGDKDVIIMALIKGENFKEVNWNLLQTLIGNITNTTLQKVLMFMRSKSEEYAESQVYARLLVQICKNGHSDLYSDILMDIIQKNKTLLKRQALKYLSTSKKVI